MTFTDLTPLLDALMHQNLILFMVLISSVLSSIVSVIRLLIVIKRSVKGRMDHVRAD